MLVGGALVVLAGAATLLLRTAPPAQVREPVESAPGPSGLPSSTVGRPARPGAAAPMGAVTGAGEPLAPPVPGSLQDTTEDGALRVDASGHLVLSADVRRLFDYYLSATGEESPESLRARIIASMRAKLPASALDEALRVLDDYLAYRQAARTLEVPAGSGPEDVAGRLDAVRRLRREHLGTEVADAFFAEDEQHDAVALQRMRLEKDTTLSSEERARRIEALEETLPADLRALRQEALHPLKQQAAERELVAAGASAEDLHQYRLSTEGPEATARLEALDQERAEWQRKLTAFRAKRQALTASIADPTERAAAAQRLLVDSFSPEERVRVQALEAMDAAQAQQPTP
ncbi:lipase chaperone [Corallococcus sp. H22C18031201]|nr:lipase chaperone [Corallococcus sp. H22C18031201]